MNLTLLLALLGVFLLGVATGITLLVIAARIHYNRKKHEIASRLYNEALDEALKESERMGVKSEA